MKYRDLMIDLETLATTADAVIMSIGAVKFNLESSTMDPEGFYSSISIERNHDFGRRVINEDTLLWWLRQEPTAQAVFHEPKVSLEVSLIDLSDWISTDDFTVWSNGADFDLPMLAHAYSQIGVERPWKPYSGRCVRTYKNLPGAKGAAFETIGVKHNALSDAVNQARQVQAIYQTLFAGKPALKARA